VKIKGAWMLDRKQRIIWNNSGTLRDLSAQLNDYRSGVAVIPFIAATDAIYIGAEMPFNHKYFDVLVANVQASTISVDIWNGSAWVPVVDLIDETASAAGASMSVSGKVSFAPDLDKANWQQEQDSKKVIGLETTRITYLYWARVKFSANLTASFSLKYVGHLFSDDGALFTQYPDLDDADLLDSFQTGKTDWKEQALTAAEIIVQDLRRRNIVMRREQIMDDTLFVQASVNKTASIIYGGLGNGFTDSRVEAQKQYDITSNIKFYEVDRSAQGRATEADKRATTGFLYR
jgi:hypothetical protein